MKGVEIILDKKKNNKRKGILGYWQMRVLVKMKGKPFNIAINSKHIHVKKQSRRNR